MTFHPEILSATQRRVLEKLAPVLSKHNFYLVGGTAIALHLGHRRSVDLDWFTGERLSNPMRLAQALREEGTTDLVTEQIEPGTLHGRVQGVRVSLLEYRYPLLQPLVSWSSSQLAALDDLACMKLSAIAQRGAKKDFLDLYALVLRHRPLPELLELYQEKYDTRDTAHLLYALAYFDDADRQRTPVLLWDLDWPTVKEAVRQWIKDLAA